MDDLLQILVYVAFLLIYLVSRIFKNKKATPATRLPKKEAERDLAHWEVDEEEKPVVARRQGRSGMDEPERKPNTFEDMLKEMTGFDQWEEQNRREEDERRRTLEEQKRVAREKAITAEKRVEQKAATYSQKFADSVAQAKKAGHAHGKKLKEIERLVEPVKVSKGFRKKSGRTLGEEIAASLHSPRGAKRAIILSEIINRKHF